jgi:hypothetical protein
MSTPYSYRQYAGNGSTTTFSVPFPYLLKAHVKVYLNYDLLDGTFSSQLQEGTGYSWTNGSQIQLTTAPATGAVLTVLRDTPDGTLLVLWQDGSNLVADDLQTSDLQNLYVVQEATDRSQVAVDAAVAAANTANSALAAVSNQLQFVLVANVAAIPSSPSNGDFIEVADSTGIEAFSPLTGKPPGFVGDPGLAVRMGYSSSTASWSWLNYYPVDADARYLKRTGGTMTGAILGDNSTSASSPGYAFDGDTDTGLYRPGANELGLAVGGQNAMSIDASKNVTFPGDVTIQGSIIGSLAGGVGVKLGLVLALS